MTSPWTGDFVATALNVRIRPASDSPVPVADLVGLALRRNPKRAHLLVSQVLAKHVPTEPSLVIAAGELLGAAVADTLAPHPAGTAALRAAMAQLSTVLTAPAGERGRALTVLEAQVASLHSPRPDAVVIGYAETATGLGRLVANALGAYYLHSTRHATPGVPQRTSFEEGHSHATSHRVVPSDPRWLHTDGPVVLVDDELSTGATVINTIRALHTLHPHGQYLVAALIDLRSAADRERFAALAAELDVEVSVVALGSGSIELGPDILARAGALIETLPRPTSPATPPGRLSVLRPSGTDFPPVRSDRFGVAAPPPRAAMEAVARQLEQLLARAPEAGPVVVLGTEEHMFVPLAVADALARLRPGVRFSTTTRSPIVPVNRADYAVAGAVSFASHDLTADGPGIRFAYNLTGTGQRPGTIVVFPEPGTDLAAVTSGHGELPALTQALQSAAGHVVLVLLPADYPDATPAEDPA